jgi:hypothetical protein
MRGASILSTISHPVPLSLTPQYPLSIAGAAAEGTCLCSGLVQESRIRVCHGRFPSPDLSQLPLKASKLLVRIVPQFELDRCPITLWKCKGFGSTGTGTLACVQFLSRRPKSSAGKAHLREPRSRYYLTLAEMKARNPRSSSLKSHMTLIYHSTNTAWGQLRDLPGSQ